MHEPSDDYFNWLYDRLEVIHERYGHEYACGIFMSMLAGLINRGLCEKQSFDQIQRTQNAITKMANEIDEINKRCQPYLEQQNKENEK